jgi:hypothetical protein
VVGADYFKESVYGGRNSRSFLDLQQAKSVILTEGKVIPAGCTLDCQWFQMILLFAAHIILSQTKIN